MRNSLTSSLISLIVGLSVACSDSSRMPVELSPIDGETLHAAAPPVKSELLGSGSIQSDGLGTYTHGVSGVSASVGGDWVLDLSGRKSTRKASVAFTDSLPGNPSPAPFASALVAPRIIAKGGDFTPGGFTGMVGLGSTIVSPLSLAFAYNGKSYGVRMNSVNHPQTDWALVTCIGVTSTNACNKWRLTPTGSYDGSSKNIGRLEEVVGTSSVFIGLFYFSFDIVITK